MKTFDANGLHEIEEELKGREHMGARGLQIDEWLEQRGITCFAEWIPKAVADTTLGVVSAGGSVDDVIRGAMMHGFFVGLEAGRRTVS